MTMVMQARTITATKLKAQLLGALDDVAATGQPYVVTKHGKPVAKIVPADPGGELRGSVTYLVSDEELIAPLDEPWDALAE